MDLTPLELVIAVIVAWLAIGTLGLARPHALRFVGRVLFCAGAVVGLVLAVVALIAIGQPPQSTVLPLGLPDLPFHLRLDSLSAFFLLLLGAAGAAISLFSAVTSVRAKVPRRASSASSITSFSPRWRWCWSRTTLTSSWSRGDDGTGVVFPGHH